MLAGLDRLLTESSVFRELKDRLHLKQADENISIQELSDEFELNVEVVYSSEDINEPVELSFSEAFTLAREKLGPGCTFVWNDNQYTTDRADDYQVDESDKYVLDTTSDQSTAGESIIIAP